MSSITWSHQTTISRHVQALLCCSDVVKLVSLDAPGWTWEVVNHIDGDYFTCKVISPVCPDGEWGEIDFRELSKEIMFMSA
jgi:hypothetical protein